MKLLKASTLLSFFFLTSCSIHPLVITNPPLVSPYIITLSDVCLYDSSSLDSKTVVSLTPQKFIYQEEVNGFFKVETDSGAKWIYPTEYKDMSDKTKFSIQQKAILYESNSFKSPKHGEITPQTVTELDSKDGWYKIDTYLGEQWVTFLPEPKPIKPIYLTFDDGPSAHTAELLDVLNKYNAKATFFMIEPNMRTYPKVVKRLAEEGNYIGLHSVSHDAKNLYGGSPNNVALEMEMTQVTLENITGEHHILARVPYGSKPYMKQAFRDAMVVDGFKMWDWTIDSEDWRYDESKKERILETIKEELSNSKGNPEVILMHDRASTIHALPEILEFLLSEGYTPIPYEESNHFMLNFWKDDRL